MLLAVAFDLIVSCYEFSLDINLLPWNLFLQQVYNQCVAVSGLWLCSHKKKRMKQVKKMMQRGLMDSINEDPFSVFVASTEIRYCYYAETEKILGNTFGMCVLQVIMLEQFRHVWFGCCPSCWSVFYIFVDLFLTLNLIGFWGAYSKPASTYHRNCWRRWNHSSASQLFVIFEFSLHNDHGTELGFYSSFTLVVLTLWPVPSFLNIGLLI